MAPGGLRQARTLALLGLLLTLASLPTRAGDAPAEVLASVQPDGGTSAAPAPGPAPAGGMASPHAGSSSPQPGAAAPAAQDAKVQVHSHTAFSFKRPHGRLSPGERAQLASRALQALVAAEETAPVEFKLAGNTARFRAGKQMLFDLTQADAQAEGEVSLERFAELRRTQLEDFLAAERRRARLQHAVLSLCLTVSLAFVGFLLIRGIRRWGGQLQEWLESEESSGGDSLRSLFAGERTRWFTLVLVRGLQFFAYCAVIYAILLGTFSLFASTRALREHLTAWATRPLVTLVDRVASALPTRVLLVFVLAVVQAGWHAISVTAHRVATRRTVIPGIPPTLVSPVRLLVRAALVLGTPVLLVPFVTGDPEHVLARIGFLLLQVLCVSAIPVLATMAAGVRAVLGQHYRLGEWLVLWDGLRGEVCEVDLFHIRLVPDEGGQVRVPHLLAMLRPVHHLPSVPPLAVDYPVPASMPPPVAAERLQAAATAFATLHGLAGRPTVALMDVQPGHAVFRVDIAAAPHHLKSELLLALSAGLLPTAELPLTRTGT